MVHMKKKPMTDIEFNRVWQALADMYSGRPLYIQDTSSGDHWAMHIKDNMHVLPEEAIDMIAMDLPESASWSEDVVKAAQDLIAERYLLKGDYK